MKKTKFHGALRIVFLILILVLCAALFGSCRALDEMKDHHAVWNNDSHSEILYRNAVYKQLYLSEKSIEFFNDSDYVHVTEPDVPVLMMNFSDYVSGSVNSEETVIRVYPNYEGDSDYNIYAGYDYFLGQNVYYAREDCFDEYSALFSAKLSGYSDDGFYMLTKDVWDYMKCDKDWFIQTESAIEAAAKKGTPLDSLNSPHLDENYQYGETYGFVYRESSGTFSFDVCKFCRFIYRTEDNVETYSYSVLIFEGNGSEGGFSPYLLTQEDGLEIFSRIKNYPGVR